MAINFYYTDEYKTPDSSFVECLYYNNDDHLLAVKFRGSGAAVYKDVPRNMFIVLRSASSVGKMYNNHVKDTYDSAFGGTRYGINFLYAAAEEKTIAPAEKMPEFVIRATVDFSSRISAPTPSEAVAEFKAQMIDAGFDESAVNIKEVVVPFAE